MKCASKEYLQIFNMLKIYLIPDLQFILPEASILFVTWNKMHQQVKENQFSILARVVCYQPKTAPSPTIDNKLKIQCSILKYNKTQLNAHIFEYIWCHIFKVDNSFSLLFTHLKILIKEIERRKNFAKSLNWILIWRIRLHYAHIHKYHTCNILQSICVFWCVPPSICIRSCIYKYSM